LPEEPQSNFQSRHGPQHQRQSTREKSPSEAASRFSDPAIFKERFNTIERVFGWEDKFPSLAASV